MSQCECIQNCPFFTNPNVRAMTKLVQELQATYCYGDNTQCARYIILQALGKAAVPELMLPNQHDWAKQIIRDPKKPH